MVVDPDLYISITALIGFESYGHGVAIVAPDFILMDGPLYIFFAEMRERLFGCGELFCFLDFSLGWRVLDQWLPNSFL